MSRNLCAVAALAFCFAALSHADDKKDDKTKPAKPKIEGVSLNVMRKLDEKQFGYSFETIQIGLLVSAPGKQLLGVDSSSKVEAFSDEKGTDLLVKDGFNRTSFNLYPRLANDRESMVVTVQSPKAPPRGITKVTTKGDLVATIGTEEKTTEEATVKFEKDAKVKLGDMSIEVTNEKGFGTDGAAFVVKTTGSTIKSISVKDGDGKAVMVAAFGRYGFGKEWTHSFTLKKAVKEGKVSVTYFSKEEKLTIPVDIGVTVAP